MGYILSVYLEHVPKKNRKLPNYFDKFFGFLDILEWFLVGVQAWFSKYFLCLTKASVVLFLHI